jgi:hypothetical protein
LQKKNGQCESVFNDNEEEDEFKRPSKIIFHLKLY